METFSRMVKKALIEADRAANRDGETLREVEVHVRQHLSSVCNVDDDPGMYYPEVTIRREPQLAGYRIMVKDLDSEGKETGEHQEEALTGDVLIVGEIARDAVAPYLAEDWTPEGDIAVNPLSVWKVENSDEVGIIPVDLIEQPTGEHA